MTNSGAGDGSPTSESRRQWLQRWVAQGVLTSAQATAIDQYEVAYAETLAGYDRGAADQVLIGWIQRWVSVGFLTAQQADTASRDVAALRQADAVPPSVPTPSAVAPSVPSPSAAPPTIPPPGTVPPPAPTASATPTPTSAPGSGLAIASEVLGYLGAALAIGSSFWLMRNVWPDFDPVVQALIAGIAALVLTVSGFLVRLEGIAAFKRLRIVIWLASTAVTGAFGAVLAVQFIPTEYPPTVISVIGACVALQSVGLWQLRRRPAHQLTALIGLVFAVSFGAGVAFDLSSTGVIIFFLGLALLGLGFVDEVRISEITLAIGAATTVISIFPLAAYETNVALISGSVICGAFMLVAVLKAVPLRVPRRIVLGATGVVGAAIIGPWTIMYFAESGASGIGAIAMLIGIGLVVLACTNMLYVPEISEVVGAVGVIIGVACIGIDVEGVAPILGICVAVIGIVVGNHLSRVPLTVMSWIGLAIFGIWELVWVGRNVNIGAVAALVLGAILVAVAVFLSRRSSGRVRSERQAAEAGEQQRSEPSPPSGPPMSWQ